MRRCACALIALAALAGCASTEKSLRYVQPPTVVTKVVETRVKLPSWATEPVPNKPPVDKSVESIVKANNARADTLDYVNCRSRLIARVQAGEKVDHLECVKGSAP
jgi:hypothetical protein